MTNQELSHRDSKKRETRAKLVLHAHKLFKEFGVSEIGMRKLASQSNLGLGTYYNYFKTKDEIIFAISDKLFTDAFPKKRISSNLDQIDLKLTDLVVGILKSLNKNSEIIFQLVQIISNPIHYKDEESEGRKFTEKFIGLYSSMVLEVIPNHKDQSQSANEDFARLCWHQLMIFIYMWFMDKSRGHKKTKKFIENTHKTLCYGICNTSC